jgi:hypothetical protein
MPSARSSDGIARQRRCFVGPTPCGWPCHRLLGNPSCSPIAPLLLAEARETKARRAVCAASSPFPLDGPVQRQRAHPIPTSLDHNSRLAAIPDMRQSIATGSDSGAAGDRIGRWPIRLHWGLIISPLVILPNTLIFLVGSSHDPVTASGSRCRHERGLGSGPKVAGTGRHASRWGTRSTARTCGCRATTPWPICVREHKLAIACATPDEQETSVAELEHIRGRDVEKDGKLKIVGTDEIKKPSAAHPTPPTV